jgi:hypothetical protein
MLNPFGWKTLGIVGLVALVAGFSSGVWVRDAFCDAASARQELANEKAESERLRKVIVAGREADIANKAQGDKDRADLGKLQDAIDELKISAGTCFTDADTDQLRNLWKK